MNRINCISIEHDFEVINVEETIAILKEIEQPIIITISKIAFILGNSKEKYEFNLQKTISIESIKKYFTDPNYKNLVVIGSKKYIGNIIDHQLVIKYYEHQNGDKNGYSEHIRKNRDEYGYLNLLELLLVSDKKPNRTKVNTRSTIGETLRFDLHDSGRNIIPLLTTKFLPFDKVVYELLWFLRGDTNTDFLKEHNVHIWDGNSSRKYLDSVGLINYKQGEVGPIYGAQWRNFNGVGCDQIMNLINGIKKDPWSRRHIVTAWNPLQLKDMALPPCHMMFQMIVTHDKEKPNRLSTVLTMRSCDMFLGVPWNIASYALLTHIIAKITGLVADELVIMMGDCHIYTSHQDQVSEQIRRIPYRFPEIELLFPDEFNEKLDFSLLKLEDFKLTNYFRHESIKADMVV
jgi:thymidylate synthase